MENCYSIKESELFSKILDSIKRNDHGLLDFLVQDILRDPKLRELINKEIEIEEEPPEDPEYNGMVIKINLSKDDEDPTDTFRLYLSGNGIIRIDWGDGNSEEVNLDTGVNFHDHQYGTMGNYTITVYGQEDFPEQEISFGSGSLVNNTYNKYIEEIVTWGDLRLVSLSGALSYTIGPLKVPEELPSTVTNLSFLLRQSDVSEVTNLEKWNTSNVTDMRYMFSGAINFNQNIGGWNTLNVTNMSFMFSGAINFNQNIGGWNTVNVMNMSSMFAGAENFNQNIGEWNTVNVTDMSYMFFEATSFNGDIGGWDTSEVTDMNFMFSGATSFNQNISGWDVSKILLRPPLEFDKDSGFEGNTSLQPQW